MNSIRTIIISMFLLTSIAVFSQNSSMWLMNGKKIVVIKPSLIESEGYITYQNEKGKTKKAYVDNVFSIVNADGNETVYFKTDSLMGETWNVSQMRNYLNGLELGKVHYKNQGWVTLGGIGAGFLGMIIPQPEIKIGSSSMPVPIGGLIPLAYAITVGNTSISNEKIGKDFPELASNEYFLEGCAEAIRKKRMRNGFIGAGIGIIGGIIAVRAMN